MRAVNSKRFVREITSGSHYVGHMEIGGAKIDFELKFLVPIAQIVEMLHEEVAAKVKDLFGLVMKKDDQEIALSEDEFAAFALMCYDVVKRALAINKMVGDVIAKDGIIKNGSFLLGPAERRALTDKFGCALPA